MLAVRVAAALAAIWILFACGGGSGGGAAPAAGVAAPRIGFAKVRAPGLVLDARDPLNWQIDDFVRDPKRPQPHADGWSFEIPLAPNSANYVTMPVGSLAGATKLTLVYRVEADPGVRIAPRSDPRVPSVLTLYFQRAGDTWSASHESYRWYAAFASRSPVEPGEFTVVAHFDQNWTAVLTSSAQNNPGAFQAARAEADRIGFVLGGGTGLGHGVYATGPARVVVKSFRLD